MNATYTSPTSRTRSGCSADPPWAYRAEAWTLVRALQRRIRQAYGTREAPFEEALESAR